MFERSLFTLASFFSRPPGFYVLLVSTLLCTVVAGFGYVNVTTYYLSVLAIVLTGVVLIQNYRDTAAMQAKLDELIIAVSAARNQVVGLEHEAPTAIAEALENIERDAEMASTRQHSSGYSRDKITESSFQPPDPGNSDQADPTAQAACEFVRRQAQQPREFT
jgi:low affinity Fe/Cu permease